MAINRLKCIRRKACHRRVHLFGKTFEERLGKQDSITVAFSKTRNADNNLGKPIEKVLAERPLRNHPFKVLVGCTNDARIHCDCLTAADPFDCALLQEAQQFHLERQRYVADLIEEGGTNLWFEKDNNWWKEKLGLPAETTRIVDIGDADIIHTDTVGSHRNIEHGVRKILAAGAIPVVLGGDHSVNIPCINAFSDEEPFHLVQIDAHLDFVDERHGVRYGHGNPMRRAAEKTYVTGLSQIGIRNGSSTAKEGYVDARAMGSDIQSVRQVRAMGVDGMLARIPEGKRYYLTIDIDAFCPSIAPGTGTPSHGGFLYYDVLEILQGLSKRGDVVGVDLVEVAPSYDPSESTQILAAQLLLNFIGFIFHNRR